MLCNSKCYNIQIKVCKTFCFLTNKKKTGIFSCIYLLEYLFCCSVSGIETLQQVSSQESDQLTVLYITDYFFQAKRTPSCLLLIYFKSIDTNLYDAHSSFLFLFFIRQQMCNTVTTHILKVLPFNYLGIYEYVLF